MGACSIERNTTETKPRKTNLHIFIYTSSTEASVYVLRKNTSKEIYLKETDECLDWNQVAQGKVR